MSYQPPSEKWHRFENIRLSKQKGLSVAPLPYDIS